MTTLYISKIDNPAFWAWVEHLANAPHDLKRLAAGAAPIPTAQDRVDYLNDWIVAEGHAPANVLLVDHEPPRSPA